MRCLRLLVLCFLFLRAPFPLPVCACALFSRGRNIKSDDDGSQESTVVAVVVVVVKSVVRGMDGGGLPRGVRGGAGLMGVSV